MESHPCLIRLHIGGASQQTNDDRVNKKINFSYFVSTTNEFHHRCAILFYCAPYTTKTFSQMWTSTKLLTMRPTFKLGIPPSLEGLRDPIRLNAPEAVSKTRNQN